MKLASKLCIDRTYMGKKHLSSPILVIPAWQPQGELTHASPKDACRGCPAKTHTPTITPRIGRVISDGWFTCMPRSRDGTCPAPDSHRTTRGCVGTYEQLYRLRARNTHTPGTPRNVWLHQTLEWAELISIQQDVVSQYVCLGNFLRVKMSLVELPQLNDSRQQLSFVLNILHTNASIYSQLCCVKV